MVHLPHELISCSTTSWESSIRWHKLTLGLHACLHVLDLWHMHVRWTSCHKLYLCIPWMKQWCGKNDLLNSSAATLELTTGSFLGVIVIELIQHYNYSNIFLPWLGVFPVDIDLSHQPPGVYSLEINATDIFNFSDTRVISYTSKLYNSTLAYVVGHR